jgi:hypothetical protein
MSELPKNPSDVKRAVDRIREMAGDDEVAHSEEHQLHVAVLRAIAEGVRNPRVMAGVALQTLEIEFSRWCA